MDKKGIAKYIFCNKKINMTMNRIKESRNEKENLRMRGLKISLLKEEIVDFIEMRGVIMKMVVLINVR